jgi:hypothetical protein
MSIFYIVKPRKKPFNPIGIILFTRLTCHELNSFLTNQIFNCRAKSQGSVEWSGYTKVVGYRQTTKETNVCESFIEFKIALSSLNMTQFPGTTATPLSSLIPIPLTAIPLL